MEGDVLEQLLGKVLQRQDLEGVGTWRSTRHNSIRAGQQAAVWQAYRAVLLEGSLLRRIDLL